MKIPVLQICASLSLLVLGAGTSAAVPVGPGDSFKLLFDLTGRGPSASYDNVGFLLDFATDDLDQNEGFSFQVFESSGAANSPLTQLLYPLSDPAFNIGTQVQVDAPMDGTGYILFTDIIGTFDVGGPNLYGFGDMQTAWGYDTATQGYTGVFPATFELVSTAPDNSGTAWLLILSCGSMCLIASKVGRTRALPRVADHAAA